MLVVLHATPVAAPMEAEGLENPLAEVGFINFVGEVFGSVHVVGGCCRLNGGASDAGVL